MTRGKVVLCLALAACMLAPGVLAQTEESREQQPPPAPAPRSGGVMTRVIPMERTPAPMARPDLGKWWKDSEIAKELGLTEQQINQVEQTFFDHRLKLIDLNADVQRNEARLQPLMEADQVDEAKIGAQMDLMLAARSRLEKANMMMMISIRKVLTVEQWKKLEDLRERRQRTFMRTPHPDGPEGNWDPPAQRPGGTMRKRPGPPPPPEDEN